VTRVVANAITEAEGWQFVIENKPGSIQTLVGSEVFRSPADGYSIFSQAMPIASAPTMLANMPFDLITDFAPVIRLSASYNVLVVTPSLPAHSIADLVALIKASLTSSRFPPAAPAHRRISPASCSSCRTACARPTFLIRPISPMRSPTCCTNQFMFITTLPVIDLIAAGKLRALAVIAPKRIDALKDVPSVVEQGFPNLVVEEWIGWSVRSGTPEEIIAQLNKAANKALTTPKVKEAFAKIGADPVGGTPGAYGALVKQQVEYWGKIVKEAGIRPQ